MNSLNLAARAGRWSADNWKKAFFGWLLLALVALVVGTAAGHKQIADSDTASGEAAKAQRILEQAGFKAPATESVLIQSDRSTVSSPRFRSAVDSVVQTLSGLGQVTNIQNPLVQKGGGGQISADRRSVLVQFDVKGDADKAKEKIEPIIDAVVGVQKANPFPTADAFDSSLGGNQDAFATKLNKPSGGLSFSTYLGGSGTDVGVGIALDSASPNPNAYIIGATGSGDFPTTPVAFDGTLAGASTASCATAPCDAFVSKIAQSRRP